MEQIFGAVDSSFKYILIGFNLMTLLVVYIHKRSQKVKKEHHLLFVTAHPDDEAMFFGPTINSLTKDYFIHLLCLSGANTERQKELEQSAKYLGIHKVKCIHNDKLLDGEKQKWCQQTIVEQIKTYIKENNIKALFTFDEGGVSGHLNHQAIYTALSRYEKQQSKQIKKKPQENSKTSEQTQIAQQNKLMKIYYLESINIIRKYTGMLQILIALVKQFSWVRINYISAWKAMEFHSSQFVWYRKLWVFFSRYSYVNTYRLRKVLLQ